MKRFVFIIALLVFSATPVFACTPPVPSPVPGEIQSLESADAGGEDIGPAGHARLDEYHADQKRIAELWTKLNPCEMYPQEVEAFKALTPREKQSYEAELQTLYKKWPGQ